MLLISAIQLAYWELLLELIRNELLFTRHWSIEALHRISTGVIDDTQHSTVQEKCLAIVIFIPAVVVVFIAAYHISVYQKRFPELYI